MRTIDTEALRRSQEQDRFAQAKDCPHLAMDRSRGAVLWHQAFCMHPDTNAEIPPPCTLIWRGRCAFENIIEGEIVVREIAERPLLPEPVN